MQILLVIKKFMISFILQNKYFQYFDWPKTRHDQAKIGLAGQHDRPPFKNYFEPWIKDLGKIKYMYT